MKVPFLPLLVLLLAAAAGCAPPPQQEAVTPEPPTPANPVLPTEATAPPIVLATSTDTPLAAATATALSATTMPPNTPSPNLLGLPQVDQAKADLAARLNVSPDDIEVVTVEAVVWPDGSFGCPQPGVFYAQVLQEGLFVQLRHAGQLYHYHSGGAQPPFLCEQPFPIEKGTPLFGDDPLTPPAFDR